jgi:mannose-6-phosphate isomerase
MGMSASFQPYPLLMDPFFSPRPWGGDRLRELLGKQVPDEGGPFGEAWELSDHPDGFSRVANGPAAGELFGDLVRRHPRALLALDRAPARYPLLVKYIDNAVALSIQVHPDDAQARPLGERGKFECWFIIDCPPGTEIVRGLKPGVTAGILREAAIDGDLGPVLRRLPIRPGDVVTIPPGVVHALLGKTLLCEIQQAVNLTYRLWDWNRQPPRPLQIEEACAVTRYDAAPLPPPVNVSQLTGGAWQQLVRNPCFEVNTVRWSAGQHVELFAANAHGQVFNVVQGAGTLEIGGCQPERVRLGQTWFVPAGMERWSLEAEAEGLRLLVSQTTELGD